MTAQLSREPIYQVQCLAGWIDASKQCYQAEHEAGRPARILYTAPPAPVAVPSFVPPAIEPDYEVIKGVLPTANPDEYACCIAADMWNACRAAMLKGDGALINEDTKQVTGATVLDGWVLVPRKMTGEMLAKVHPITEATCPDCGKRVTADCEDNVLWSWDDILSAAPAAPEQEV